MDKIITISSHSKNNYKNTSYKAKNEATGEEVDIGCGAPIEYVSYPVRKFEPKKVDLNLTTDFNFLAVAQISPRKNVAQLIKAYIETFREEENVGLIIKANLAKNSLIDRRHTLHNIKQLIANFGDRKCKIYLLHGYLSDSEMASIYTNTKVKALVSTTHGEGFGLPLFEAAYYGLPVIATDWGGQLDFLYKPVKQKNKKVKNKHMFSRISYSLAPIQKEAIWDGILVADSMWAFPEEGSIKMNLRELHEDHGRFKKRAKELQTWICKEFNAEKQYAEYIENIISVLPEDREAEDWLSEIEDIVKEYD